MASWLMAGMGSSGGAATGAWGRVTRRHGWWRRQQHITCIALALTCG